MSDDAADWTFGRGGFAKLYGDRLAQSSLLDRDVVTRWVFLFMLSQADEQGRYRCASVAGLARAAAITLEQAERAVAELEAPDPDSTTKLEDGRRIVRIAGGWQLVTFTKYREFRTPRQLAEAAKKKRQREARKATREKRKADRAGHVPGRPRDVRGTLPQTSDVKGQRTEEQRTTDCASASPSAVEPSTSKGPSKDNGNGASKERTSTASWSREACNLWVERFNGTANGGQIGKALKPLVVRYDWPTVREAWRSYLAQTEAEYASPQRFASTFGSWAGTAPPARGKATRTDQMLADVAAWAEEGPR